MKTAMWAMGALLAGCGTTPPSVQIIKVPVHIPCVEELPVRPEYEFDKLALDATSGAKVLALARDWPRGRKYEGELRALMAGCTRSVATAGE